MPTKQQVIDETEEQKLNEWAAVYCMGYTPYSIDDICSEHKQWWVYSKKLKMRRSEYNPCQDKAQAFDLMVKYGMVEALAGSSTRDPFFNMYKENPCKAIVVFALLSAIGEEG